MESRKVIKIKNSLFTCIPFSMAEALGIEKGDRCQMMLLPGYGILLRKEEMEGRFPAPLEAIADLQKTSNNILHDTKRKLKGMENQTVSNVWYKIFGLCLKDGFINIFPPIPITEETQKKLVSGEDK